MSASKYEQKINDLPVSTSIIQPDFINKNNFQTFDQMLRDVPGIQMNLEQPSIRGSSGYSKGSGARVLLAVNGIPLYTGDTGEIIWELIPTMDIERIEIIKGPASSLYGSSAIGGVINIITKAPVKKPVTHFRSYLGAYDKPAYDIWKWNSSPRTFYGIELTHSNSINNLGYTFSFKRFDDMSYRQNDYSKRYLGYIDLNYDFSPMSRLSLFADFLNMDRGNFIYWKDSRDALVPPDDQNGNTVKSNRLFTGLIYRQRFIENTFAHVMPPALISPSDISGYIKAIGPEHCVLSTDFGQIFNPPAPEGFHMMLAIMLMFGLTEDDLQYLVKINPARILGLI